jgi:NADPH2:quinone reductase
VFPLIASGRLAPPVIDSVLAMTDAHQAHARMATSAHIGKLVLAWEPARVRDPAP